jgi:hypothetical protein
MTFKIKDDFSDNLKNDLHKKYLSSGKIISGSIKNDKVELFLEDEHGKHSAFMSQIFFGKIVSDKLTGRFRPAAYVMILLIILFAFAVESIIAAIILKYYQGVVLPSVIIIVEFIYLLFLKKLSFENNELIKNYLLNM